MTTFAKLLSGARVALETTFLNRGHLPGSPWNAYLTPSGGIIVDRTDNPEQPIPDDWRLVCRVDNGRTNDSNMLAIEQSLGRMPIHGLS